jgi:ring-1,2-phenylacetyl-CoA epoxidase subunit PaaC
MQQALEQFYPYTNEWFTFDAIDERALGYSAHDLATQLRDRWLSQVDALCKQSHLRMPASSQLQTRGRFGVHGEHLSLLLAEMQSVARAHPGASW